MVSLEILERDCFGFLVYILPHFHDNHEHLQLHLQQQRGPDDQMKSRDERLLENDLLVCVHLDEFLGMLFYLLGGLYDRLEEFHRFDAVFDWMSCKHAVVEVLCSFVVVILDFFLSQAEELIGDYLEVLH